jgi:hypothetical protein
LQRRAAAFESGLFRIQTRHLLDFRQRRLPHQNRQNIIDNRTKVAPMFRTGAASRST